VPWQEPDGEGAQRQADGDIDVKHRPPPVSGTERCDQCTAGERPDGACYRRHGGEIAECPAPLRALEELLDRGADLRGEHAARRALHDPAEHQNRRGRRSAAGGTRRHENDKPGYEEHPVTVNVAQPPARHKEQAERYGISRDNPLQTAS
jgi:hypothetical protein